jgi:uncharacterized protein (DUF486 family)
VLQQRTSQAGRMTSQACVAGMFVVLCVWHLKEGLRILNLSASVCLLPAVFVSFCAPLQVLPDICVSE